MDSKPLIIASRESALAIAQVHEALESIKPVLPANLEIIIKAYSTPGDRDLKTSLADPTIPQDYFTRDLDLQLLNADVDLTIHSAKDLPSPMPPGLTVAALLPAREIRDALVVRNGLELDQVQNVGSSSPKRGEELSKTFPSWTQKPIRGTIASRLEQLDRGDYDAVVIAACALERLQLADRIHSMLVWDPTPNQGRLALVTRNDETELIAQLRRIDVRESAGMVALLGCPADYTLIPKRALEYLHHADVVIHDRLIPDEVLHLIHDKAVPVGKAGGKPSTPQSEIHRLLLHHAEEGKLVVRLHGGDPGIYGRLNEELDFLTGWGLRVDIVPSVTAAQVAAARAGAPLTHRGEGHRLTLISGAPIPNAPIPDIPGPDIGNLAVYMGVGETEALQKRFEEAGWQPKTTVIVGERLGNTDERVQYISLDDLSSADVQSPAVFIVGANNHPVHNRLLFTGIDPSRFLKHGPLIHWPMIELAPLSLDERAAHLKDELEKVKGIVFPSRFAVQTFMEALLVLGDARLLNDKKLAAVGPTTQKELAAYGLRSDITAKDLHGIQSLVKELSDEDKGRYLYPCSNESPKQDRVDRMREFGIELLPVEFYSNQPVEKKPLPRLEFRRVLFTSSSTVKTYFNYYPEELKAKRSWIAVGPSTLKTMQSMGLSAQMLA